MRYRARPNRCTASSDPLGGFGQILEVFPSFTPVASTLARVASERAQARGVAGRSFADERLGHPSWSSGAHDQAGRARPASAGVARSTPSDAGPRVTPPLVASV